MPTTTAKNYIESRRANPFAGGAFDDESREIAKALNDEARDNWDSPEWQRQVAQDVADVLDYGFTNNSLFSSYVDVANLGEFDRMVIKERRGLKTYYTARGGYIDETTLTTEHWEVPRDQIGFHVVENTDRLRANFAETLSDVVRLGQSRLEAEVNRRLFSLLQAAVPNGASNYTQAAGVVTAANVNAAIRAVKDAVKPNGVTGVPVTIVGRASVVDSISDFTGFGEVAKEELRQKGVLGVYRGANVVSVNNFVDEDNVSYFPANELWVLGGTCGKFGMFGPLKVRQWEENTVDYTHYRARKDIGGLIHHPEQSWRLVDTGITP